MAFPVAQPNDRDQQRAPRPSGSGKQPSLEQHIGIAISSALVIGIGPVVAGTIEVHLRCRANEVIDVSIDLGELAPALRRHLDASIPASVFSALLRKPLAELKVTLDRMNFPKGCHEAQTEIYIRCVCGSGEAANGCQHSEQSNHDNCTHVATSKNAAQPEAN